MRKKVKIKHAEEFERQHLTSTFVLEDPDAAAAYAAQEAFAAGVSPSAVMYSSPDGPGTGEDYVQSQGTLSNSSPQEAVAAKEEEPEIEEKAVKPTLDKAIKPKLDKVVEPVADKPETSSKNTAPVAD